MLQGVGLLILWHTIMR